MGAENMADHYFRERIQQLLREHEYAEAVQLSETIQLNGNLTQSFWHLKAQALQESGNLVGAERAYRSQLTVSDNVPHIIQLGIGVLLLQQGRFLESAICLNEFCQHEIPASERSMGLFFLASSVGKLGNREKERELLREAIELDPLYDEAWHNLGSSFLDDDSSKSIEPFLRALEIDPDRADTYGGLATAYLDQSKYKEALECVENGLAINPLSGIFYQTMGECYEKMCDFRKAEEAYHKAMRCDYDKPRALLSLVLLFTAQGRRFDEIEKLVLVGLQSWPDDSRIVDEAKAFVHRTKEPNFRIVEAVTRIEGFRETLREFQNAVAQADRTL